MLKTIDWRDTFKTQSIIKTPSWHDLLDMDPLMIIGYCVVGGAGLFAIGMARLESKLAKKDDDRTELVSLLVKAIIMAAGITGAIYYIILKNPLWKFIQ